MQIILIGERNQQSSRFLYILDNIQNCEIHFTNIEKNLLEQIQKIKGLKQNQQTKDIHSLLEINKSNISFLQTVISQFKKSNRTYPPLILLINDDEANEEAIKIKNQLNRYLTVQIENVVGYFKKNYDYDKQIDLNGKQVAMFLSKEQDVKNTIFQTVKSPAILQNKWALINTPQFDMNADVEQRNESINDLKQIFQKHENQISLLFIIVDQERDDLTKKNFNNIYCYLRKFQKRIILLLYNRLDENFQENFKLYNYFMNIPQIRDVYSLSNSQLQNQQQIDEYFNQILQEQQDNLEIGIDMKETIFEIRDETQSEIEKETFEKDFQNTKVQELKQGIDQDDQQIKLYQQKIAEVERSKQQKLNQIREIETFYKQQRDEKIQSKTQVNLQNQGELIIPQQKVSYTSNQNQAIVDIKDSQTIIQDIQNLEKEKKSINQQLQECYNKLENISKTYNQNKYIQQLKQQIDNLWKKIEENDQKIKEYNNQLEQLQKDNQKDSQKDSQKDNYKYNQINNAYNGLNTASIQQTYSYGYYGSGWS